RPELERFLDDALRRHVAPQEERLGPGGAKLLGRLLGRAVVPEVADRHAPGAELGEAECDRPPHPPRAARPEDRPTLEPPHRGSYSPRERLVRGGAARDLVPPRPVPWNVRALLGLGRRVAEAVEQLHPLLRVAPNVVVLWKVEHELADARAKLVGEVRSRGT